MGELGLAGTRQQAPAGGPQPRLSRAAARQLAAHAGVLAACLAAGVAFTWPLAARVPGWLPSDRDVASYVWDLWWVAHQAIHLASPWRTGLLGAPAGVPLGFDTLMPLPGLVLAPVTLTAGPAVSYSILVISLPGLLCWVMYRTARLWLASQAGALAAGAFFGLSAMLTWQDWYHVNIAAGELFLPLALTAAVRLTRAAGPRRAAGLGLVLGLAALVNQESAILACLLAALTLVPWLARGRSFPLAKLRLAAVVLVTALAVASPQLIAMVAQAGAGGAVAPAGALARSYRGFGVGLPAMFAPSPGLGHLGLGRLAAAYRYLNFEAVATFGVVLSATALAGLAVSWRRRSARLLALLWAASCALALGSALHLGGRTYTPLAVRRDGVPLSGLLPFTWLMRIPGLDAFREADRFTLLGLVPAALLAGAAVAWLAARARPAVTVLAIVAAAEAGWAGGGHFGKSMPGALPAVDRPIAADHSGSIVVDVPFGLWGGMPAHFGGPVAPDALVLATADGHPRAESYSSWIPGPVVARLRAHPFLAGLVAAQHGQPGSRAQIAAARADAARIGAGWAVVWRHWPGVFRYLREVGFRFRYRAAGVWVYRLPPRIPDRFRHR
jgi:hypothetical protein